MCSMVRKLFEEFVLMRGLHFYTRLLRKLLRTSRQGPRKIRVDIEAF